MKVIKRFIAGAVCPRCGVMDRIVSYSDEQQRQVRECVECGFNERLRDVDTQPGKPEELETRVTRKKEPANEVKAQPIKFFPRMPGKSKPGNDSSGEDV
ncbi:DNA-binding protein [Hahella sp. CCB-MM4]|uniref:YheV family putative zinc ribbon protein n=1 Tax=Hahella sp. (strain CCB-MM4) TaxID=1926491 RepID=UPI000B9A2782|nr:YheV family putative zinc ribbon protein [Hahella sp. CCB-MM4]OZG73268.1 DNA-binding protein [Hahella sp. CCB-MM4]